MSPIKGLIAAAAIGALCTACASSPTRPTEAMVRAQTAYDQAEQAGARNYDAGNLETARDKLTRAKAAADKGKTKEANFLADQAELDAELAAARTRSATAEKAAAELRASINTLRSETQRPAAGAGTP